MIESLGGPSYGVWGWGFGLGMHQSMRPSLCLPRDTHLCPSPELLFALWGKHTVSLPACFTPQGNKTTLGEVFLFLQWHGLDRDLHGTPPPRPHQLHFSDLDFRKGILGSLITFWDLFFSENSGIIQVPLFPTGDFVQEWLSFNYMTPTLQGTNLLLPEH